MSEAWAEVIGDPVSHSLSPAIHGRWLRALGLAGQYRATRVPRDALENFILDRRAQPGWRGCNVTAPHKEAVGVLLDRVDADAAAVGAVNCIYRNGDALAGTNTDVDGIDEALAGLDGAGRPVVVIGSGGAARAAVHWARSRRSEVTLVVRRPETAAGLAVRVVPFDEARAAIQPAYLIINATPLGLEGGVPMPDQILGALAGSDAAAAFDMVYRPLETPFLAAARAAGLAGVDGLAMLIGQARRSFFLLFRATAPPSDDAPFRQSIETTMQMPREPD